MIKYYSNDVMRQCIEHAELTAPEEACGFIVKESGKHRFIAIKNTAKDKLHNFSIPGSVYIEYNDVLECIVHSHNNSPHASPADQKLQKRLNKQCGIIFLSNGKYSASVFFGGGVVQDLLYRPFTFGVYDCFSIVRDYYYKELNIDLPNYVREYGFWESKEVDGVFQPAEDLIMNNIEKEFAQVDISEIKKGDIITMKIGSRVVNHIAVYADKDIILHHLHNKISTREPIYGYMDIIEGVYRHI